MRWFVSVVAFAAAITGCVETSPFESDDLEYHDLNAKNLERLVELGSGAPYKFAAISDTHDAYDDTAQASRLLSTRGDVGFVVHGGDLTDRGLLKEFEWSQRALDELRMPLLVGIGNHDALSRGPSIYRDMYGTFDFSFVWGGLKWIFFNSNRLEFDERAPNRQWLTREIDERSGAEPVVLVTHQPMVDPEHAPHGELAEFYDDLLRDRGVRLVIHGHLDGWRLYRRHSVPILQCSTFENWFYYTLITVDGTELRFERCRLGECLPVEPEPEAEAVP